MRPAELWPYLYDRPQTTPLLWISEGITDFYADLAEVRRGLINAEQFYAMTTAKVEQITDGPAIALETHRFSHGSIRWMVPMTSITRRARWLDFC